MICYKDRTFCRFYEECKDGSTCSRALTTDIIKNAEESKLPVSQYAEKPECFKSD